MIAASLQFVDGAADAGDRGPHCSDRDGRQPSHSSQGNSSYISLTLTPNRSTVWFCKQSLIQH